MKRSPWTALVLSLALALGLTACGPTQQPEPADTDSAAQPADTQPDNSPAADPSLTQLQTTLSGKNAPFGIAFLGNLSQGGDWKDLLAETGYLEIHPFLADIPADQVVTYEGTEVYCVVPRDQETALTVQTCLCGDDGQPIPQDTLYQGTGQPVILVCNVSDIIPNVMVTVTPPGGSPATYAPCLSLCDGSVALPSDAAIYDFSLYETLPATPTEADFLGTWRATETLEGEKVLGELDFQADGTMTYRVGSPESEWIDNLEGTWYVIGQSSQYPAGSVLFELRSTMDPQTPDFWGVFTLEIQGKDLVVTHVSGDPLFYGYDGKTITYSPY
ncbi:MAG: hypothetical protein Q4C76_06075 [Bacillota bacterium]|nr:hypothetical protein [Bacillota bacterium]